MPHFSLPKPAASRWEPTPPKPAFAAPVRTSGVPLYFSIQIPADTSLTAATEAVGFKSITATRTWATTGTVTLQRENWFQGPTYASASASQTFTDAFTVYMDRPLVGTNAIFTRAHTLGIVDSTSAASSITGGFIVATTLGTTATSVGIGGGNINAGGTIIAGGAITAGGAYTSSAPAGGAGAGAWKLGTLVTAAITADTTRYIELDVGGTLYKIVVGT